MLLALFARGDVVAALDVIVVAVNGEREVLNLVDCVLCRRCSGVVKSSKRSACREACRWRYVREESRPMFGCEDQSELMLVLMMEAYEY